MVVDDPTRERFGGLAKHVRRGAAEDEETTRRPLPIGQHAEHGKEIRSPLDLIQDHETVEAAQRQLGKSKKVDCMDPECATR